MVDEQLRARDVEDERVLEAMRRVPRELFVHHGQTISQPYMVARICQELRVRPGDRVLDVGTGSGYQAAVLAELGAEVHGIERVHSLVELARANLGRAGYDDRVTVHEGDGTRGLPELAPFAAVAVAAAAPELPPSLYAQVRQNGRIVVPVGTRSGQRLEVIVRTPEGPAVLHSVPCRFVPLLGVEGFAADP
jgi:protein-L-isoaspartate(D-aspartate) O-methyltransferase